MVDLSTDGLHIGVHRGLLAVSREGEEDVTPKAKSALVRLTSFDLESRHGMTPLSLHVVRLARDLAGIFEEGKSGRCLDLPRPPGALVLAALGREMSR